MSDDYPSRKELIRDLEDAIQDYEYISGDVDSDSVAITLRVILGN